jgi:hypothetical protein
MSNQTFETEIEITPEMIEAGARSFRLADVYVMSIEEDERAICNQHFYCDGESASINLSQSKYNDSRCASIAFAMSSSSLSGIGSYPKSLFL